MQQSESKLEFAKARISDVRAIHQLINEAAGKDQLLPRSLGDIYEKLRDFHVCFCGERLVGCCALHIVWDNLSEIRSLVVDSEFRNRGIGSKLVANCLQERAELAIEKVFVLTFIPSYFERFGFRQVRKDSLPHKVWSECVRCPKFPDCDEVALEIRG